MMPPMMLRGRQPLHVGVIMSSSPSWISFMNRSPFKNHLTITTTTGSKYHNSIFSLREEMLHFVCLQSIIHEFIGHPNDLYLGRGRKSSPSTQPLSFSKYLGKFLSWRCAKKCASQLPSNSCFSSWRERKKPSVSVRMQCQICTLLNSFRFWCPHSLSK